MEITTTTTPHSVTLPLISGGTFDLTINWGDGTANTTTVAYNGAGATHSYAAPGTYVIAMRGVCTQMKFANTGAMRTLVKKITDCVDLGFTNLDFNGCTALTKVSSKFSKLKSLTTCSSLFDGCTSLNNLPADMFKGVGTNLTTAAPTYGGFCNTFRGCTSLTSIPATLFQYNTALTTYAFPYTFSGCTSLTAIPDGLFDYAVSASASAFYGTFYNCSNASLTSIPASLFEFNTGITTNAFYSTFYGCSKITSLDPALFSHNTGITTTAFGSTFRGCHGLTSLPATLFSAQTGITTGAFTQTFYDCYGLTSLPATLFSAQTGITTGAFDSTFYGCYGLTLIPDGLLKYCTSCITFNTMFGACTKAKLSALIFWDAGGRDTRFLNQSVDFSSCFSRSSWTGSTQGTAPDIWNCNFGTGTPTRSNCFAGAGNSATSLSNYAEIQAAKLMTTNVAPATDWAFGNTITGQTSGHTGVMRKKVSATTWSIVLAAAADTFHAAEQIGVTGDASKLAQQTGSAPTFVTGWGAS